MKKETLEKIEKATPSFKYRIGKGINSPFINVISKFSTPISFLLSLIMLVALLTSFDKLMHEYQTTVFMMEDKIKIRNIHIKDTVKVNECDTVYMINGEAYTRQ